MKLFPLSLLFVAVATGGCIGPERPPHAMLPPIVEEYYVCEKCGSLHGGIYGKGPLADFAAPSAAICWHRWKQIPRKEFQVLAGQHFPGAWAKANGYVKRP